MPRFGGDIGILDGEKFIKNLPEIISTLMLIFLSWDANISAKPELWQKVYFSKFHPYQICGWLSFNCLVKICEHMYVHPLLVLEMNFLTFFPFRTDWTWTTSGLITGLGEDLTTQLLNLETGLIMIQLNTPGMSISLDASQFKKSARSLVETCKSARGESCLKIFKSFEPLLQMLERV